MVELPADGVVGCDKVPELESVLAKLFSRARRSISMFWQGFDFLPKKIKKVRIENFIGKVVIQKLLGWENSNVFHVLPRLDLYGRSGGRLYGRFVWEKW